METDEEARRVLEMAKKAEGSIRNTSTHAAGLIISASIRSPTIFPSAPRKIRKWP